MDDRSKHEGEVRHGYNSVRIITRIAGVGKLVGGVATGSDDPTEVLSELSDAILANRDEFNEDV